MKSTRRRIGRKIVVDGKTYYYKVCVPPDIVNSQEPNLDGHVIVEVRGPKPERSLSQRIQLFSSEVVTGEGSFLGLGLGSLKRGDKVAITPKMVADAIRKNIQS